MFLPPHVHLLLPNERPRSLRLPPALRKSQLTTQHVRQSPCLWLRRRGKKNSSSPLLALRSDVCRLMGSFVALNASPPWGLSDVPPSRPLLVYHRQIKLMAADGFWVFWGGLLFTPWQNRLPLLQVHILNCDSWIINARLLRSSRVWYRTCCGHMERQTADGCHPCSQLRSAPCFSYCYCVDLMTALARGKSAQAIWSLSIFRRSRH